MRAMNRTNAPLVVVALLALAVLAAACSSDEASTRSTEPTVKVAAAFYPLQWMAQQVGGDHVDVSSLTPAGAEPHDLELTASKVEAMADADLVVVLTGFQPAVDAAIETTDATVFDAADSADLDLTFTPIEEGEEHQDEAGTTDPHFWLDPTRLADVATTFAGVLAKQDPAHAADYRKNAEALDRELDELDSQLATGLEDCASKDLVTSHNAFGYLARRYGLNQLGITGLTPDEEPSPADLASVTDFVKDHQVRTIYFETLVSPRIAETVAAETGTRTDVLDPIEGISDTSQGADYLEIMEANLANLREGQGCS